MSQGVISTARKVGLRRRGAADKRLRFYGFVASCIVITLLLVLLGSIFVRALPAFTQYTVDIPLTLPAKMEDFNAKSLLRGKLREFFPTVEDRQSKRALYALLSRSASFQIRNRVKNNPELLGKRHTFNVLLSGDVDVYLKSLPSMGELVTVPVGSAAKPDKTPGRITSQQIEWVGALSQRGLVHEKFNTGFFTNGDSRDAEVAGIWGSMVGSFLTLLVMLLISLPMGLMTAIYLEEFSSKSRWIDFIEVSINNLAAVPSIVFGLLGLAFFLNFLGFSRSTPLVGGMVLSLIALPTIVIASKVAIGAVPNSIRMAALGMGASHMQTVFHHVLPLALPGILTGNIISVARIFGETAPLLMIGMMAFIVDIPASFTDNATALPVQVYLWSDNPERGFEAKTSAAALVLLVFLITINAVAVILRTKLGKKW